MSKYTISSKDRYRSFFEQSRELIYICDPAGKLIEINPAGVRLLGYDNKNELIGMQFTDLYLNPEDRNYYRRQMSERGYVKDFETILIRKNGDKFFGVETANMAKDEEERIIEYRGIIRDNTERIKHEMLIMKMNLELIDANKRLLETQSQLVHQEKLASIGHLSAGIAHEINNPLGFVFSNFEILYHYILKIIEFLSQCENSVKTRNTDTPMNAHYFLSIIQNLKNKMNIDYILNDIKKLYAESNEGFNRILTIIKGLKTFSRIDSNAKVEQFELNKSINNTLLVAQNEIKYVVKVKKYYQKLPLIEGFRDELNQVFLNIIINAAQAVKSQHRTEPGLLTIKTYDTQGYIYCEIQDDGPGIPKRNLTKIFDPFFTTKEAGEGTGLGLSISYDIIKKHKGDIIVKSEIGKGTSFIIKLPEKCAIEVKDHDRK